MLQVSFSWCLENGARERYETRRSKISIHIAQDLVANANNSTPQLTIQAIHPRALCMRVESSWKSPGSFKQDKVI